MTAYYRTEARQCLVTAKRDFLFYMHYAHIVSYLKLWCHVQIMLIMLWIQDGKYVQTALSVEHPDYPPIEGIPRAQVYLNLFQADTLC